MRFLTHDDPAQTARAITVMKHRNVRIAKTVALELAWVLRSAYDFPPAAIIEAIERLGGMHNVSFEDPRAIVLAVALMKTGVEIEDALHLAACAEAEGEFVTFDAKLAKRGTQSGMKITLA
ncbi:MAG: type II toxin-antitoxin system VapC family toxin [Acidobacteriia bacterium]|nr:type II toxin-antitoxin system VapC family toxin [Terriglobia bacterium]